MDEILNKIGQINNTSTASYNVILERVIRTVVEMLKDRGYSVSNDCRTVGDITYKMQENDIIVFGEQENKPNIVVYFHNEERIGVKQLREWNESFSDSDIIIVSLEGPTAFTKKEVDQHYPNVQFFLYENLCINITKHHLVPRHEKIQPEDIKKLNIKVKNNEEWPKIYVSDPVVQYYDFKPGDLIRITRTIGYPEPIYYYRLVCSTPSC